MQSCNAFVCRDLSGNHGNDGSDVLHLHEQPHQGAGHDGQSNPGELLQQPDLSARGEGDEVRPPCTVTYVSVGDERSSPTIKTSPAGPRDMLTSGASQQCSGVSLEGFLP